MSLRPAPGGVEWLPGLLEQHGRAVEKIRLPVRFLLGPGQMCTSLQDRGLPGGALPHDAKDGLSPKRSAM